MSANADHSSYSNKRVLIVSLHDLHPGSLSNIQAQIEFLESLGVNRTSILVIPHYHHAQKLDQNSSTLAWLDECAEAGHDLVLHGYFHDRTDQKEGNLFYTRFYTANEAEFLNLPNDEVINRIQKGSEIWRARGWPLSGFIAPAWLMPITQHTLLRSLGFTYTTHLRTIELLRMGQSIHAQSLCYSTRAGWRVHASYLWNHYLHSKIRAYPVLRLSLHPQDLEFSKIKRQIQNIIQHAIDDGRKPVSYAEYAQM